MAQLIELKEFKEYNQIDFILYNDDIVNVLKNALCEIKNRISDKWSCPVEVHVPDYAYFTIKREGNIKEIMGTPIIFSIMFKRLLFITDYEEFIEQVRKSLAESNIYIKFKEICG